MAEKTFGRQRAWLADKVLTREVYPVLLTPQHLKSEKESGKEKMRKRGDRWNFAGNTTEPAPSEGSVRSAVRGPRQSALSCHGAPSIAEHCQDAPISNLGPSPIDECENAMRINRVHRVSLSSQSAMELAVQCHTAPADDDACPKLLGTTNCQLRETAQTHAAVERIRLQPKSPRSGRDRLMTLQIHLYIE